MNTNPLPPPLNAPQMDQDTLAAIVGAGQSRAIQPAEAAALERLISIAHGDSGQSRCVADFLLAWWNAGSCGSFDLTTPWGVDSAIAADMGKVFTLIALVHNYPDTLGYEADFKAIVHAWRPELSDCPIE